MSDLSERIRTYLSAHTTLNLATHGPAGVWACAVLYVSDGVRLYFTSVAATRHGQDLVRSRRAAGTINDDCNEWLEMKGLQLEGAVELVEDLAERTRIVRAYLQKFPFGAGLWHGETDAQKIAADPGVHAFFRLTPERVLFTDNEHHPQGREELPLPLS